jgi:hypothetical protein
MDANDAGGRWSANPDADGNLSAGDRSAGQQRCEKYHHDHTSHRNEPLGEPRGGQHRFRQTDGDSAISPLVIDASMQGIAEVR